MLSYSHFTHEEYTCAKLDYNFNDRFGVKIVIFCIAVHCQKEQALSCARFMEVVE